MYVSQNVNVITPVPPKLLLLLLFIVKNADCKYKINGIAIYTLKTKRNHQKKTGFANITCNDKHILKRKCLNLSKAIILPCP